MASPESMMEILLAFEEESDSNVWSALSSVLEGFNTLSQNVSPECNAAYRQIATRIVGKAFKKVGFDTSEKDSALPAPAALGAGASGHLHERR